MVLVSLCELVLLASTLALMVKDSVALKTASIPSSMEKEAEVENPVVIVLEVEIVY